LQNSRAAIAGETGDGRTYFHSSIVAAWLATTIYPAFTTRHRHHRLAGRVQRFRRFPR
jgi:hypothetical protein